MFITEIDKYNVVFTNCIFQIDKFIFTQLEFIVANIYFVSDDSRCAWVKGTANGVIVFIDSRIV